MKQQRNEESGQQEAKERTSYGESLNVTIRSKRMLRVMVVLLIQWRLAGARSKATSFFLVPPQRRGKAVRVYAGEVK